MLLRILVVDVTLCKLTHREKEGKEMRSRSQVEDTPNVKRYFVLWSFLSHVTIAYRPLKVLHFRAY